MRCRVVSQALESFNQERRIGSDLIVRDIMRSNKNILSFPTSSRDAQLEYCPPLKQSEDNIFNSEPGTSMADEET